MCYFNVYENCDIFEFNHEDSHVQLQITDLWWKIDSVVLQT